MGLQKANSGRRRKEFPPFKGQLLVITSVRVLPLNHYYMVGACKFEQNLYILTTEPVVVVVRRPPTTGPYVVFTLDSRK